MVKGFINNIKIFKLIESEMLQKFETNKIDEDMISRPSINRKNNSYKDKAINQNSYIRSKAISVYNYYIKYSRN